MTIEVEISLSDETHEAVLRALRRDGGTLAELVDAALRSELARRDAAARPAASLAAPAPVADQYERLTRRANGHRILR